MGDEITLEQMSTVTSFLQIQVYLAKKFVPSDWTGIILSLRNLLLTANITCTCWQKSFQAIVKAYLVLLRNEDKEKEKE